MSAAASQVKTAVSARIEPALSELMALAGPAASLPQWSRAMRVQRSGQYLSRVRGRGMEYDESRPYQPGDDIRQLDWRVTARTGKAHTKLFREERERPVVTIVDFSPSMFFATRGVFKAVQAARIAALLAWRAHYNGDRIGGFIIAPSGHHELAPKRGKNAVIRWLKMMADSAPTCRREAATRENPLTAGLTRLERVAKPGTLIFVISDFVNLEADASNDLARLAQHADVGLVQIADPLETQFPNIAGGAVSDRHETLQIRDVTAGQRQQYAQMFTERSENLRRIGGENRMSYASASTEDDAMSATLRLFQQR